MAGSLNSKTYCYGESELFLPDDESICHAPALNPAAGAAFPPGPVQSPQLARLKVDRSGRVFRRPTREDVRQQLHTRLVHLRRLRAQTNQAFDQVESSLHEDLRQYKTTAIVVDVAAMVIDFWKSLAGLVKDSYEALKLTGEELARANRKLVRHTFEVAFDPVKGQAKDYAAGKMDDHKREDVRRSDAEKGLAWAAGAAILSLDQPSFWAQIIGNIGSGKTWGQALASLRDPQTLKRALMNGPDDIVENAKERIERQRAETLRRIDARIRETERALNPRAAWQSEKRSGSTLQP